MKAKNISREEAIRLAVSILIKAEGERQAVLIEDEQAELARLRSDLAAMTAAKERAEAQRDRLAILIGEGRGLIVAVRTEMDKRGLCPFGIQTDPWQEVANVAYRQLSAWGFRAENALDAIAEDDA